MLLASTFDGDTHTSPACVAPACRWQGANTLLPARPPPHTPPRNIFHLPTLNGLQRLRLWQWRATYRFHSKQPRNAFGRKAKLLGAGEWPPLPETEYQAGMRMATVLQTIAEMHPGQRVRGEKAGCGDTSACGGHTVRLPHSLLVPHLSPTASPTA